MTQRRVLIVSTMVIVILLIVGCDQGTKSIARSYLREGNVVSLFGGVVVMRYVENQGAFLSLGARLSDAARRTVLIAFPLAALGGMILYVARKKDIRGLLAVGLSCVAGGGLGNLLDRVVHDGRVADFLNLGIGGMRTGIFNLADVFIVTGCLVLLFGAGRDRKVVR